MEKYVFAFPEPLTRDFQLHTNTRKSALAAPNNTLHSILSSYKEKISKYYAHGYWDHYKKCSNKFELVSADSKYMPHISNTSTISRSYYKLWEMLHDFEYETQLLQKRHVTGAFLAEGPGGFVEAFVNYRKQALTGNDTTDALFGMTLISQNKNVPNWNLTQSFTQDNNICLLKGVDGTGSLYNIKNIWHMVKVIGANSCDVVTGDGGFDFSHDFNMQEPISLLLIACEVYSILLLQKLNGFCVVKMFDIRHPITMTLVNILHQSYDRVYVIKPFSSRPANSEKYFVCIGFKDSNPEHLVLLENAITNDALQKLCCFNNTPIQRLIIDMNKYFVTNQVWNILKTLALIETSAMTCEGFYQHLVKSQLEYAIRWCHKYKIPISITSLKLYQNIIYAKNNTCPTSKFNACKFS